MLREKYERYRQIQRHKAGETLTRRGASGSVQRLYLSDWVVLNRFELRRQAKRADHEIHWMALDEILDKCAGYDVISFDVFDTLLCRGCGTPSNLFLMLEKQNCIPDFAEARQAAERRVREEKKEVTLSEIYARMEQDGIVKDGTAAMRKEWEMEKRLIAPHPLMLRLVKKLTEQGKRIIAVSDMYLSAGQIGELLSLAGYPKPERIIVSCETGVGKAGGQIYQVVKEHIQANSILHIGDNEDADGCCAEMAGLDTALLRNPALLPWEYFPVTPFDGDMIMFSLIWRNRYGGTSGDHSDAWNVGYSVTGPLTVGFCQWIRKQQQARNWDRLFFSARDGWIMHQIYTRYFGDAEYLPVSRAAVQMLDADRQIQSYCDNNLPVHLGTGETVGQVMEGLGLAELLPSWQAAGLNSETILDQAAADQIQRLMYENRARITEVFAPARAGALGWLKAHLEGVARAAVIDTGWKGSAGATLRDFVRENGLEAELDTVLMGTSRAPSVSLREERGELMSWLFSTAHDRDRMNRMYQENNSLPCSLFEMLFMTALPQLMSYAGEGFTYGPANDRFRELAEELQAGAMAFAEDFNRVQKRMDTELTISAAAAWRVFEELLSEKERIRRVFGSYVHTLAPVPEAGEVTYEDRMRQAGWL